MRTKILITFSILCSILWITSCRKDFDYAPSNGHLSFSRDTVYLDTVFSNIGSSTYLLKVFNDTKDDVLIPTLNLRNGLESFYRLNVDGVAGKEFNNVPIYAKDSLFILIETTIDITDSAVNELLYIDAIDFDSEPYRQSVQLVTLAKDAIFLYPNEELESSTEILDVFIDESTEPVEIEGFVLNDEYLTLNNQKPYVVYGYAIVEEDKELIIEAGSRLHFHENSGILIKEGATLTINGQLSENDEELESEVIFEGDRLEPSFNDIPGQWGAIWISQGSQNNMIDHLTLKNAQLGLFVQGQEDNIETTLTLTNSKIFNSSTINLWAKNAKIYGKNLVLGNAGNSSLLIENGGNYSFIHTTVANYWNKGFRFNSALDIRNHSRNNFDVGFNLQKAEFKNSIIDGNGQNEISLTTNEQHSFNFHFQNCYIKLNEDNSSNINNPLYDLNNTEYYTNIITAGELDYFSPTDDDFRIGLDSDVLNKGDINTANSSPIDIIGTSRLPEPDLGAYQAINKEN
ncbi:hypothetical protein [Maribacter litoralis]|uniref:hypothetical protein n=1 Tax=Maribacter litoralis TaxID=2059726 RepID=UPI003D2C218D